MAGRGVLRRPGTTVPSSSTVTRWSLAWMAASARDAACSFWTGLMLSPWRLSVARGAQLPQCVGAHVSLGNSGAHSWLRWSVTLQLLPVQSHVLEHLCFPVLDHGWRRSWINVLISLRIQLESRSSHAGCSLLLDKRGRGPRKKSAKAWGGRSSVFWHWRRRRRKEMWKRAFCRRSTSQGWRSRKPNRPHRGQERSLTTDL